MSIEVYTVMPTPFALGGTHINIKTKIDEYERISIGSGFYGILFKNPFKNLWHIALEDCGALIGTNKSRAALIKGVKKDIDGGDQTVMAAQISQGVGDREHARLMSSDEWFEKFEEKNK